MGHLPLVIDIAASPMNQWTEAEFLANLKQEKSLLNNLIHEGRSMQAAYESGFNLLSAEQQRFFAILSKLGRQISVRQSALEKGTIHLEQILACQKDSAKISPS